MMPLCLEHYVKTGTKLDQLRFLEVLAGQL